MAAAASYESAPLGWEKKGYICQVERVGGVVGQYCCISDLLGSVSHHTG